MKKYLRVMIAILFTTALTACSEQPEKSSTQEPKEVTVDDVINTFKEEGLEAEEARKMTKDDYGMAPMKAEEAKIVLLPSVCEDCGGRIFSFENEDDLLQTKAYYDEMGKESAILFSWTLNKDNILVQLNGDLPEEKYNEYKKALENIKAK
ncbi:hypothetical protein [Peribacillus frigoritolerans]